MAGLTEAVLAFCEDVVHNQVNSKYKDVDFESQEYYSWLVDESNRMADYIFDGIDNAANYFVKTEGISQPPTKNQ